MQSFLTIRNLCKQFGQFTALDDISLSVEEGEFICFLGPSGCGKTTLLRMIAGLEDCQQGEIWQNNVNITRQPPEKRDFGIVFQSYALFPNLTVFDNIAFGLRNQGKSKNEVRYLVNEWLDTIGLPDAGRKFPGQLSGGQQQRIALARALALSPGLLLLDEPLSALDAKVRVKLRESIRGLQKRLGITTIMVTHDQEEAMAMADRIVVMNHGHIEQVGTSKTIYQQPASRFVAEFIGSMNFLEGHIDSNDETHLANTTVAIDPVSIRNSVRNSIRQNDKVLLGIRPEDLHFGEGPSELPVTIENLKFQGTFVRAECSPRGWTSRSTIKVDVPIHTLPSLTISPGSQSSLILQEQHIHVFPAEAS